jgi:hypothetical protein
VAMHLGLLCSADFGVNLIEHGSVSCFDVHRAVVRGDSMRLDLVRSQRPDAHPK